MKRFGLPALLAAALLLVVGQAAQAVVITPGTSTAAVADGFGIGGGSVVAGTTGDIPFAIGPPLSPSITGEFKQTAYFNTANPFGAGLVSLVYEFNNNSAPASSGNITRMTTSDFTGVGVDMGWLTPVGPLADTPDVFDRTTVDAIGVRWDVAALGSGAAVNPGEEAAKIVIHTDQPLVALTGVTALINGGSVNFATFVAVPEPSAFLYGGLVACIAGLGYRGRQWFGTAPEDVEA